jgi:hypothetical protein
MSTPSEELFKIQEEIASLQAREDELNKQAEVLAAKIDKNAESEAVKEQAAIDQLIQNWIDENTAKLCKNGFEFRYDANYTKTLWYHKKDSNKALVAKQFNFAKLEQVDEILTNIEHIITLYQTVISKPISDNDKDFKENLYIAHAKYVQTEYNTKNGDTIHVTMQYDGSHVTLKVSYDSSEFYNKDTTIIKLSDTTHVTIFSYGYDNHEVDLVDESTCSLDNIPTAFKSALDKLTDAAYNYIENMIE